MAGGALPLHWDNVSDDPGGLALSEPTRAALRRVQENFDLIARTIGSETSASTGGWTNATMLNSWAHAGDSLGPPLQYRKTAGGLVSIRGAVGTGTSGTIMCTLPEGLRPDYPLFLKVLGNSDTAGCFITVEVDGDVFGTRSTTNLFINVHFWVS